MKKNVGKISVKEARKILGELGKGLADEEVKEIADVLWNLAEIEFKQFIKTQNHE
jgi:Ca2+-binding EF-hand superfamily protein